MCFRIHDDHTEPKIAQEDIICYKLFLDIYKLTIEEKKDKENFYSIVQHFKYPKGKRYDEKDALYDVIPAQVFIEEGLHSYSEPAEMMPHWRTDEMCWNGWNNAIQIKCIIPKGTKYYYNPDYDAATSTDGLGSYVSESIIIGTDEDIIQIPGYKNKYADELKKQNTKIIFDMEEKFTISEFKNYLISSNSIGDALYYLNAENVKKAQEVEEIYPEDIESDDVDDSLRSGK